MRSEMMLVTPKLAKQWMDTMGANRRLSWTRVKMYSRDMAAGRWEPTNQGIGFSEDGRLLDGQHRLQAIIESGVSVTLLVVWGLSDSAQNHVDVLRPRSISDQMLMNGDEQRAKDLIARARIILLLVNGWETGALSLTFDETRDLIDKYRQELEWSIEAIPKSRGIDTAPVAGAWAYAYGGNPEVAELVAPFRSGAGLDAGNPMLALRNHLLFSQGMSASGSWSVRRMVALKTLRALWATVNGERLSRLHDSNEGLIGFAKMRGDTVATRWLDWTSRSTAKVQSDQIKRFRQQPA